MYVLLTLLVFSLASMTMVVLRITRARTSYSWLTAVLGGFLGWVSILFWQVEMPVRFSPSQWIPTSLFSTSPELLSEPYAWLFAISLAAVALAVVLTSPARAFDEVSPAAWAGTMAQTALAFLAVLSDNPLTLALAWTAIDLTEFFNTLRASVSPTLSERTVVSFAIRAAGTGLLMWASVASAGNGQVLSFENITAQTGLLLLIAAGLRLGVLPLHLTFRSEPVLRRGYGTVLRLTAAASSLILVTRLPFETLNTGYVPLFLVFVALSALYAGWMWFSAADEISGRPYWIIGMSALSLAAALRGSSAGSAAWGAAMILFGGISFLYSARQVWFSRVLAGLAILLFGLPFSLTATGWAGAFRWPLVFWPLFLAAHIMLVAGYLRHLFHPGENSFSELPSWARTAYPIGLAILVLTAVAAGLTGWPGALQLGAWLVALILVIMVVLIGFVLWRFGRSIIPELILPITPGFSRFGAFLDFLARMAWIVYRTVGRLFTYAANLLEGDGGLLWTLLLLILFILILRGR